MRRSYSALRNRNRGYYNENGEQNMCSKHRFRGNQNNSRFIDTCCHRNFMPGMKPFRRRFSQGTTWHLQRNSYNRSKRHNRADFFMNASWATDKNQRLEEKQVPYRRSYQHKRAISLKTNFRNLFELDSNSDNESEVLFKSEDEEEVKPKIISEEDRKLASAIWSEESDSEEKVQMCCNKRNRPKIIPKYDGETTIGEEGVSEVKVYHCTFCNIICLSREKSIQHMLTDYHYNRYKNYIINYEKQKKNKKREKSFPKSAEDLMGGK